jgi:prephenate dehydrogenase
LPSGVAAVDELVDVRIPVPDRPGVIAEVTTLAAEMDVNIFNVDMAHSVEGDSGVFIITIDAQASDRLCDALTARGYHPSAVPVVL